MSKKVLITGGAGFIGSNLVSYLNETEPTWDLTVLDDLSSGLASNLDGTDVTLLKRSILDIDALDAATSGKDIVVHLAAIGSVPKSISFPIATHNANVTGTLNVLEAAKKYSPELVIVASSSSVYGSNPHLPKSEDDFTRPLSPYAVSKLATETYALAYQSSYGLSTLALRFFNVYGPRQRPDHPYAAVIPKFIKLALEEKPLDVFGDGTQTRDFTFVDSVCSVIRTACVKRISTPFPVNLGAGSKSSVLDVIQILEELFGHALETNFLPPRLGDVPHSEADKNLFREIFPEVTGTSLRSGLDSTLSWISKKYG